MVFHGRFSDIKSSQVSRTLLSILADLNNAVVWMVSSCPVISKSSSICNNTLVTVPSALITIGITVTSMYHSFFNSLARSKYLSFFGFLSVLLSGQPERQSSLFCGFTFFFSLFYVVVVDVHLVWSSGRNLVIFLYLRIPVKFIIIIIIINYLCKIFTPVQTVSFSLQSEW